MYIAPPKTFIHIHGTHIHVSSSHFLEIQLSTWRTLPDVPYYCSSVCVVEGVLLAIGGAEDKDGSKKTATIYGFCQDDNRWEHIGDLPFACCWVDTLLLSGGGMLVVDGHSQQVLRIAVEGKYCCNEVKLY